MLKSRHKLFGKKIISKLSSYSWTSNYDWQAGGEKHSSKHRLLSNLLNFSTVSAAQTYHPYRFSGTASEPGSELTFLSQLAQSGFRTAPIVVVPAALEEHFYRLNNLPAQLAVIFKNLDLADPDEDDIEDMAPQARALLKKHYLLDEVIDVFYREIEALPRKVQVRRMAADGYTATRGRPALMKLKQLWTDDWSFDAVLDRLDAKQTFGLEARPILLHAAGDEAASSERNQKASDVLSRNVILWEHPEFGVTRVFE